MASERALLTAVMLFNAGKEDGRREATNEIADLRRRLESATADRIVRIDTTPDGDLDELVTWGHGHLERLDDHVLHLELGPVALWIASAAPIAVALRDGGDWPEIERPAHPVRMPQPDEGDTL